MGVNLHHMRNLAMFVRDYWFLSLYGTYLANEVCEVRKLTQSMSYIHEASIVFMKLTRTIPEVIKKY